MSVQKMHVNETWRLFIGIELPVSLRRKVTQHIEHLRRVLPDVRASWTRVDNLHLTLKFLGETAVEKVEQLSQALKAAAGEIESFELEIAGCGAFPPRGKPNVLWIGVNDPSGNLRQLQNILEDQCSEAGFSRDQRGFHPHLTIARLRQAQDSRHLAELHQQTEFEPVVVKVQDVCLIRSELGSGGSRYTTIARHQLQ